jgi:hypothetical protein
VGENPTRRKSKVSSAMSVIRRLVGPKPRAKAVGDGQQVDIPVLRDFSDWSDGIGDF